MLKRDGATDVSEKNVLPVFTKFQLFVWIGAWFAFMAIGGLVAWTMFVFGLLGAHAYTTSFIWAFGIGYLPFTILSVFFLFKYRFLLSYACIPVAFTFLFLSITIWERLWLPIEATAAVSGKIIDNEDKTAGLKGVDANGNGIRDDIDRLIASKYARTPEIKKAAEQKARALQRNMEATTRAEALRAGDAIERAGDCVAKVLPLDTPEQIKYWKSMSNDIVALTANTKERFTSYWKANSLMSGAVFQQPSEPVCD